MKKYKNISCNGNLWLYFNWSNNEPIPRGSLYEYIKNETWDTLVRLDKDLLDKFDFKNNIKRTITNAKNI